MFGLDWWILLLATIVFNLCWPPITLAITLWYAKIGTDKTLNIATSMYNEVKTAIKEEKEKEKLADIIAGALEEHSDQMAKSINGFKGDVIKVVEQKIDEKGKELESKIKPQGAQGGSSALEGLLAAAGQALVGG